MNGFIIVNEKDWENATSEQREWLTYNTLQSIDKRLSDLETSTNKRIKKLENKKFYDKTASFAGGIVGGFSAFLCLIWTKIKLPF